MITYFLVVYRVETGQGWTKQTAEKLTSLRWNRGGQTTTDEVGSIQPQILGTTTAVAINSPPGGHSDSAV